MSYCNQAKKSLSDRIIPVVEYSPEYRHPIYVGITPQDYQTKVELSEIWKRLEKDIPQNNYNTNKFLDLILFFKKASQENTYTEAVNMAKNTYILEYIHRLHPDDRFEDFDFFT